MAWTIIKPSLLICGIRAIPTGTTAAGPNLILSDIEKLKAEGCTVHMILLNTDADAAVDTTAFEKAVAADVAAFEKALATRTQWDGVNIGFGVRGNPALTPLFERLVNAAVAAASPPPRMIFTENIDKLYVATRRAFPKGE